MPSPLVLVTGATGYVGGRLVPRLLKSGQPVRAMARSLGKLGCRPWSRHPLAELAQADVMDPESLGRAARGCSAAYYLVHSMHPGQRDFAAADRTAASTMAQACKAEGVARIIYLSGLTGGKTSHDPGLSHHLRSRAEVAEILGSTGVPVTVLRAAQILGAGSASFEIMRYLVDRLPVMLTPRWVRTETQPIAVGDVLSYLEGCLAKPETKGQAYDIGGPDILSYKQLFDIYCKAAGLNKRLVIPVPFLSPWLSSHWVAVITPLPASLARPLILGLKNRVVCAENRIREIIPLELTDCATAIATALDNASRHAVDTCWSDAGAVTPPEWVARGDPKYAGGAIKECSHMARIQAPVHEVWKHVASIGGETGWFFGDFLWRLRGWMDNVSGGVGLRRGRRDPHTLYVGDALDFWRVLDVAENKGLLLLAEMNVPGEALLEFRLHEPEPGVTELVQRSRFLPRGLAGLAYWYATYPLHVYVFRGMLKALAKRVGKPLLAGPARYRESPACVPPNPGAHAERGTDTRGEE